MDIGQSVVVKKGTIVAVEAFEGTDAAMERGGRLGKGEVVLVKVSKPNQDFRFDVPVVGAADDGAGAGVGGAGGGVRGGADVVAGPEAGFGAGGTVEDQSFCGG